MKIALPRKQLRMLASWRRGSMTKSTWVTLALRSFDHIFLNEVDLCLLFAPVLVGVLMVMTTWCFIAHDPLYDALYARDVATSSVDPFDESTLAPIFFWMQGNKGSVKAPPGWICPPIYRWLTVRLPNTSMNHTIWNMRALQRAWITAPRPTSTDCSQREREIRELMPFVIITLWFIPLFATPTN